MLNDFVEALDMSMLDMPFYSIEDGKLFTAHAGDFGIISTPTTY